MSRQNPFFGRDKHAFVRQIFVTTNMILSPQTFCRDKHTFIVTKTCFVVTNTCLSRHKKQQLVAAPVNDRKLHHLLWQSMAEAATRMCRDKNMVVATKLLFYADVKHLVTTNIFVTTNIILSQQKSQKFCRDKYTVVATGIVLLRQKTCFVPTKMILVAAPASDRKPHHLLWQCMAGGARGGEQPYGLFQNVRKRHAHSDGHSVVHQPTAIRPWCQNMQR